MKKYKGKTPYVIAISLIISIAALFASIAFPKSFSPVQNIVFDGFQQIKPRINENSAVAIIDIDQASLQEIGQWPWPRTTMARILEKARDAGALVIAFDIVFSEPDRTNPAMIARQLPPDINGRASLEEMLNALPDNDVLFANAVGGAPVVLGFFGTLDGNARSIVKRAGVSWLGADLSANMKQISGGIGSLAMIQEQAMGHGFITLGDLQTDDIVRRVPLFASMQGSVFPALSVEALRLAVQNATGQTKSFTIRTTFSGAEGGDADTASGGRASITAARVDNFIIPLTEEGDLIVYYARNDPKQYISARRLLNEDVSSLEEQLAGKIVLVGASATGLRDVRSTTLREAVPGVSVHSQIIDQIMQGQFLSRPDWAPGAEAVLAIIVSTIIVVLLPLIGALSAAVLSGFAIMATIATSWFAFDRYGLLLDPTLPFVLSIIGYGLTTILLYFFAEREKRFVRNAFQRYLAPNLLAKLEDNPGSLKLGGEIRDMTLMFLDIRGFTPISEKLDPQSLVAFLNDLLSPLSDIIQEHEGAIDKYIGDSIMAFWNAPLDVENHAEKACRAALAMLAKVEEMNKQDAFGFHQLGLGDVAIGIGINTGEGCVGNMGSATRFDYSVVGDTVNIAARLESASKEARWPLLVSRDTSLAAANLAFLQAGMLELKGKSKPQEVFALVGDESLATSAEFTELQKEIAKLQGQKDISAKPESARERNMQQVLNKCLATCDPRLHDFIINQASS